MVDVRRAVQMVEDAAEPVPGLRGGEVTLLGRQMLEPDGVGGGAAVVHRRRLPSSTSRLTVRSRPVQAGAPAPMRAPKTRSGPMSAGSTRATGTSHGDCR
ncbi:hypothetical protein GCM10010377_32200 [Streptomyces viridiviolaceus]|nr:hypothetical protein GCM10010377_32200 [Streptomyces viridiviolaceus]